MGERQPVPRRQGESGPIAVPEGLPAATDDLSDVADRYSGLSPETVVPPQELAQSQQAADGLRHDLERGTWDLAGFAQSLHAQPEAIEDAIFGAGLRFALGAEGRPVVDVYRDADVLQLKAPDTEVTIHHLTRPILAPNQVVFERQKNDRLRHLSLTSKGEVTLLWVPVGPAASQEDEEAYLRSLEQAERPATVDEYGFDDIEMRRLLDEGLGAGDRFFPAQYGNDPAQP